MLGFLSARLIRRASVQQTRRNCPFGNISKRVRRGRQIQAPESVFDVENVNLNELAVVRGWCWGNFGNNELLIVGDQAAVLAVSEEDHLRAAINFNRLRVVYGEDSVSHLVLSVEEKV